jgi:hemerythrin-like domain-containing protein
MQTKFFCYITILVLFLQCRDKEQKIISQFPGKPGVPAAIKKEHEELLNKLKSLDLIKGKAEPIVAKLSELIQHHFKEEEDYVFPPLGILPLLAGGGLPEQSEKIIMLSEKFALQNTHIIVEHQMIRAYINELKDATVGEDHPEIVAFVDGLDKHAQMEEEVLFPTAILIGEYLKLKSKKSPL